MSEDSVIVEATGGRPSAIWIVPLVALILGVWLAVDAYLSQGPTVTIRFSDAGGIQKEKTLIKVRNVTIGMVNGVRLAGDLEGVVVTAALAPEARPLLREDSEFWVMKAEVRSGSISGLGTLLSGAYIEIAPGVGEVTDRRDFVGLDERPSSPAGTPGLPLRLVSESSGSVSVGSPILYRGYQVGLVERIELDVENQQVMYSIFVEAPFDKLLSSNTRFWNASGISAELSSEGIKVSVGSLQSALRGGVAFDLPRNSRVGRPVDGNTTFRLYPNESSIHEDPYRSAIDYVVAFEQSLRGLHPGAPVTYRGIRVGSVVRIMLNDLNVDPQQTRGNPIPVLIQLEPGRMALEDNYEGELIARQSVETAVELGLRATLESGNLLTGAMFVELNFYEVDSQESLGEFLEYPMIPSIKGGFSHIQLQISQLLDKLNKLPIEGALAVVEEAIGELEEGIRRTPNSLQLRYLLVLALDRVGKKEEAREQLESLRRDFPDSPQVQSLQSPTD
ncbi:MAG: intermembrane transport protein PqiB [Pseudomonadales bacterium]